MPTENENKVRLTPLEAQVLNYLYQMNEPVATNRVMYINSLSKGTALGVLNNLYIKRQILRIPNDNGQRGWNWRAQW